MLVRKFLCAIALLSFMLEPVNSQAEPLYTVSALPEGFTPSDINNRGQIAGTIDTGGTGQAALFFDGALTELGGLGGNESIANALNDAGVITGVAVTASGEAHGFVYRDGSMTSIGAGAHAMGINARGDIVGQLNGPGGFTGFLYSDGKLTPLATLGSGNIAVAWDINDAGDIVGESSIGPELHAPIHPFLYRDGKLIDLGTLADREYSSAQAIDNAGRIVGFSEGAGGAQHAVLWEHGKLTDLGTFGGMYMSVGGINERGDFVGSAISEGLSLGFAYLDGKLVDLGTLIDPASGWRIDRAFGINDHGQIIASACRDFVCGGVRLDPINAVPEPASALMLLPGILLVAGMRRRRHRHGGTR